MIAEYAAPCVGRRTDYCRQRTIVDTLFLRFGSLDGQVAQATSSGTPTRLDRHRPSSFLFDAVAVDGIR
jgi:hypothetical protein